MRLAERVGQQLRKHRMARGLSQARLAEFAGLTPELVSRIERGAKEPRLSTLERLAAALGVDAGVLFSEETVSRAQPKARSTPVAHRSSGEPELVRAAEQAYLILERAAIRAARRAMAARK